MKQAAEKTGNYYEENIKDNGLFWGVVPVIVVCAVYLPALVKFALKLQPQNQLDAILKGLALGAAFAGCSGQVVSSFRSSSFNAGSRYSFIGAILSFVGTCIQSHALIDSAV